MKKAMITSGVLSTITLSIGIILKYMHAPGATFMISVGILLAGFVFMPLHFGIRIKEKHTLADKLILLFSDLAWISAIIGVLWRVQHWPGTVILFYSTPFILLLLYVPLYFFTGIRRQEKQLDTIMYSVLILISCGLFFTLTATPASMRRQSISGTYNFLRNEQVLKNERAVWEQQNKGIPFADIDDKIYTACENLKSFLLERETGYKVIPAGFEAKEAYIPDEHSISANYFAEHPAVNSTMAALTTLIAQYNTANTSHPLPFNDRMLENGARYKITSLLNDLVLVQMVILQNERRRA